jgi:glutathione S-transferase
MCEFSLFPCRFSIYNAPIAHLAHSDVHSNGFVQDMAVYTLYYSPGTASMCVHQALIEIDAKYHLVLVDLQAGGQRDPAYLRLNPGGHVPTLLIDDTPFTETAALMMTLSTRHPDAGLAPAENSSSRAAWYQWIVYFANTLQPAFRLWFYPTDISDDANTRALLASAIQRRIETIWSRIDAHLQAHGPYILGTQISAADLMLIMLMRWSRNMPKPATDWSALHQYAARIKARPSWQELCVREGLIEWA